MIAAVRAAARHIAAIVLAGVFLASIALVAGPDAALWCLYESRVSR